MAVADLTAHSISFLDTPYEDAHSSSWVDSIYKTVWEDVTVHHEAEYKTVHHSEEGHYETVTTGYKCSSCGATK